MTESDDLSMRVVTIAAPVRTQVVESLRSAIMDGRLAPGRRLVEKDLCQMLGVSRPSVREALRELEVEGHITTIRNRGPVVSQLSAEDALSIYQVRAALEALAAELFTVNATEAEIAELQEASGRLEQAYDSGDVTQMIDCKRSFYDALFRGSKNQIIGDVLRTMNARITRLRAVGLTSPERRAASRDEIRELVAALAKRDQEKAVSLSRQHVDAAAKAALGSIS